MFSMASTGRKLGARVHHVSHGSLASWNTVGKRGDVSIFVNVSTTTSRICRRIGLKYNVQLLKGKSSRRLSRIVIGVLIFIVLLNAMTVFPLYGHVPNLVTDPELLPETHMMHVDNISSVEQKHHPGIPSVENRKFREVPEIGLVYFSTYQIGHAAFRSVALSKVSKRKSRQMDGCRWEYLNGTTIEGILSVSFPGEHHGKAYESILLDCKLDQSPSAREGGIMSMTVDKEDFSALSVQPNSPEWVEPAAPFSRKVSYCGPPIYGLVDAERLGEWIHFHRATHSIDYFHLYNAGGVDSDILPVLEPYLKAETMDVTDIQSTFKFETWLYSQVMVVNDCALRIRSTSQWGIMLDIDEFLHVAEVPHTLPAFLEHYDDRPWVTFGSLSYDTETCRGMEAGEEKWAIERMVFHQPVVHCRDISKYLSRELCLKWDGHRKYAINPRKVNALQIHRVMDPIGEGLDIHTSVARMNHFRGLGVRNLSSCSQLISYPNPAPNRLVRDFTFARMALMAKRKTM